MAETAKRDPVGSLRLPDEEVRARLVRLEETLELIEKTPGPAGELALSAVAELAHIYGEALARAVDQVAAAQQPELLDALVRDELIDHLMVLHEIHPEPLEPRVERAIAQLRPAIEERGGRIRLRGVEHDVATVELTVEGCGSTAQGMHDAVRQTILDLAPELADVAVIAKRPPSPAAPAFVPLAGLTTQPTGVRS